MDEYLVKKCEGVLLTCDYGVSPFHSLKKAGFHTTKLKNYQDFFKFFALDWQKGMEGIRL